MFHKKIRLLLCHHLEQEALSVFEEEIERDEGYLVGLVRGKSGRGAVGKVVIFA